MMTANAQFENVRRGDIIDIGGTKALVFKTDGHGHGTAMTLSALRGHDNAWVSNKRDASNINATSETDGKTNTKAVYDYANKNGISLALFPAFEWCHSLGNGWYIPSVKQMEEFVNYFLGNDEEFDWDDEDEMTMNTNNMTTKEINEKIIDAGGTPFIANNRSGSFVTYGIYTSTKTDDNDIFVYTMDTKKNVWSFKKLSYKRIDKNTMGRAFYDF